MKTLPAMLALVITCSGAWAGPETPKKDTDPTLFVLPTLFYMTDTGFGYGFAGAYGYQSGPGRASQLVLSGTHTTKDQTQTTMQIEHYLPDGRHRLRGKAEYTRFPSDFFGLGNNTVNDNPGAYTPEYVATEASLDRNLTRDLWIRGGGFFRNQALVDRSAGDAVGTPGVPWGTGRMDAGAAAGIFWDSRDNTLAATRGTLALLTYSRSLYQDRGDGFGSLSLDIRVFRSPRPGWVLGSHMRMESVTGDCPFYFLPGLGGYERLRGYEDRRFVDRNAIVFQQDVRFPVWWRIGGCAFASTGRVANTRGDLFSGTFKVSYGAGLRYYIDQKKGMVLRADFASGEDASGMYVSFGEAF